jgi:hypothetical protein
MRLLQLSEPRQVLIRWCQLINFGRIEGVLLKNSEPILDPLPRLLVEQRLDIEECMRPELELNDFILCQEVCQLLKTLDEIKDGTIERVDVRAGIPRRIVFEFASKNHRRKSVMV